MLTGAPLRTALVEPQQQVVAGRVVAHVGRDLDMFHQPASTVVDSKHHGPGEGILVSEYAPRVRLYDWSGHERPL